MFNKLVHWIRNMVITNPRRAGMMGFFFGLAMLAFNQLTATADRKIELFFLLFAPFFVLFGLALMISPGTFYSGRILPDGRPEVNQVPTAILMLIGFGISALMAHFLYGMF